MLTAGAIDPNALSEVDEETLLKAKVFYFNRVTGRCITIEQVKQHAQEVSTVSEPASESEGDSQPRILTFAELQDLIESGKADHIPNNKIISDELNKNPPSESKAVARKKPWELVSVELP